jgi:Integrase core domain/leucine-zipper of insertion element IS481
MDVHDNARTARRSRMLIVQRLGGGWSVAAVARRSVSRPRPSANGTTATLAATEIGLADRSSCPHRSPNRLIDEQQNEILALRRQCLTSPVIAQRLSRPVSPSASAAPPPARSAFRSEAKAGDHPLSARQARELIHIDVKKLGRIDAIGHRVSGNHGAGREFVHVAGDDASRRAYTELLPDERKESAIGFTARAIDWFAKYGAPVERVITARPIVAAPSAICWPGAASSTSAPTIYATHQRQGRAVHPDQPA